MAEMMMAAHHGLEIDVEEQLQYYKSIADRVKDMTVDTIKYTDNTYHNNNKKFLVILNILTLEPISTSICAYANTHTSGINSSKTHHTLWCVFELYMTLV